jgi:hypothetical protein
MVMPPEKRKKKVSRFRFIHLQGEETIKIIKGGS